MPEASPQVTHCIIIKIKSSYCVECPVNIGRIVIYDVSDGITFIFSKTYLIIKSVSHLLSSLKGSTIPQKRIVVQLCKTIPLLGIPVLNGDLHKSAEKEGKAEQTGIQYPSKRRARRCGYHEPHGVADATFGGDSQFTHCRSPVKEREPPLSYAAFGTEKPNMLSKERTRSLRRVTSTAPGARSRVASMERWSQ